MRLFIEVKGQALHNQCNLFSRALGTVVPLEKSAVTSALFPNGTRNPTAPHSISSGPALLLHRLRFRQQGGRIVGRILVVIHFGFVVVVAKMLNIVVVVAFSIEKIKRNRRDSCMGFVEKTWKSKFLESESCDRKKRPKKRRQSPVTASGGTRPSQTASVFSRLRHERGKPTRRRSPMSATVFTMLGLGGKNIFTRLEERKRDVHSRLGPEDALRHRHVSRKRSTSRSTETPSQKRKDARELIQSYVICSSKRQQEIEEEWNTAD
ncbi:hypothetical protein Tco_1498088, partial [Tanacetum coccineum]